MNYGFIIDNRKCIGCHACTVACKAEHDVPVGVNRTWVKYIEKGTFPHSRRHFSVMRCNHCADAPCVEICPTEALHTRSDGIVDFDNRRCIGCKACMQACPYDALYIDPETHTAAKCNYCTHRVDIGLEPACVNVCPEHAIISGDMDDPATEIARLLSREQVSARKVEKGTRPNLFYIDGDDASLTAAATAQAPDYMWSSQSAGVGHYARYAETLVAKADPLEMVRRLADDGPHGPAKSLPPRATDSNGAAGGTAKPGAMPRRVYDAPAKGVLWGWEVSAYVWTKAIATGAVLVPFLAAAAGLAPSSGILQVSGAVVGMLFLALTGVLLIKDLDRPDRFAYVLLRPQWRSWLVRGGYAITGFGAVVTAWLAAVALTAPPLLLTVLQWLSIAMAALTAVYTAFLFAQAKGRDFWQSPTLALHMLVHALMAGSAVAALAGLVEGFAPAMDWLPSALAVSLLGNLAILGAELTTPHPTEDARRVAGMILSGRFRNRFWLGTILAGTVVPLGLAWLGGPLLLAGAGLLVLAGIYITEHIWVRAPQLLPLS